MRKQLPGNSFFCNCYGDQLTASGISAIFYRYSSFAFKTEKYNSTITRKTFSSHLVKNKISVKAVQKLLGHENCEITLRYYIHFSTSDLQETWKETTPYGK
jgi:site-specific recombinase XerD